MFGTAGRLLIWLVFGAMAIWAGYSWFDLLLAVKHNYVGLPIWDYWMTTMHLEQYDRFELSALWQQHNEHRVIFPELAFAADYLLFQGREIFILVLSILCHIGASFILLWTLYRTPGVPRLIAIGGALVCCVLLGWEGLTYLLSSPFLLQWTMFELFTALAFWMVAGAGHPRFGWGFLSLAIFFAAAAEFSSGQGLAIWPILFAAAYWLRLNVYAKSAIGIAGVVFIRVFFIGYQKSGESDPSRILEHFGYWLKFIGSYLGVPFSLATTEFGVLVGWLGVALFVYLLWLLRPDQERGETAGVLYGGFVLVTVAAAMLTAMGRMDPNDETIHLSREGRYLLMPILYWSSLVLMSVWVLARRRGGELFSALFLAGFTGLLVLTLPAATAAALGQTDEFAMGQVAALSMEAGLQDKAIVEGTIYPLLYWPNKLDPMLRKRRLSIYADSRFQWVGRPLRSSIRKDGHHIMGGMLVRYPVTGGFEVRGWVPRDLNSKEFVLLDEKDIVVGLGEIPDAGLPRQLQFGMPNTMKGWEGFLDQYQGVHTVRAFALSPDRSKAYLVGEPVTLP